MSVGRLFSLHWVASARVDFWLHSDGIGALERPTRHHRRLVITAAIDVPSSKPSEDVREASVFGVRMAAALGVVRGGFEHFDRLYRYDRHRTPLSVSKSKPLSIS